MSELTGPEVLQNLEKSIFKALGTYSNVHRGSGFKSAVTTYLYEQAREIVIEHLGLSKGKYTVIFCTPRRAKVLIGELKPKDFQVLSSQESGLSLGVRAIAVKKRALPRDVPFHTGGGTTRLIAKEWVLWAKYPDRFEAGTPAIINIIAFARALQLIREYGENIFRKMNGEEKNAKEIIFHDDLEKLSGKILLEKLRENLIGRQTMVPTTADFQLFVNMDNSASTPALLPAWDVFRQTWMSPAEMKHKLVTEVKSVCAGFVNAPESNYDCIFTSNTTESINIVAESYSRASDDDTEPVILNTLMEHSSNDLPWRTVSKADVRRLNIDHAGFIDLDELETLLADYNQHRKYGKQRIKLVAISGASNVLGSCNNLEEISRIVHKYQAELLVDAAQLVAHRKIDVQVGNIDYLVFSGHKIYAPFGCGVLLAKKELLSFSDQESEIIRTSGEENVAGIAALGKSLVLLQRVGMEVVHSEEQKLTAKMLKGLSEIPAIRIYGIQKPEDPRFDRKLGVVVFDLKGKIPGSIAKKLAYNHGIGVRYGCHCAHIIIKHILNVGPGIEKFQRLILNVFPKLQLPGVVRISLGIENTEKDIDRLLYALKMINGSVPSTMISPDNSSTVIPISGVKMQLDDLIKDSGMKVFALAN